MAISRRALGIGLLATSAAATGGYLYLRDNPQIGGWLGETRKFSGFIGGEKSAFVDNERVKRALARRFGIVMEARRAGSVEMVRERALLDQKPQFVWPSSSVLVDVAKNEGVKVFRDHTIFNSPIVLYSWDKIADALVKSGMAQTAGGPRYTVDLLGLVKAVIAGKQWADIGVDIPFSRARILSTDPNRSNSGFMFAGLCANLLGGDVVTVDTLDKVDTDVVTVFRRMGFKPSSSGKLFDDYIAGGPAAFPLIVGYENQLVEWVIADAERWKRIESVAPSKPVILYPRPTAYSAHPLMILDAKADALIEALLSSELQEIGWEDHGFRGPLGSIGQARNTLLESRLLPSIDSILPMPEATAMLGLLQKIAAA